MYCKSRWKGREIGESGGEGGITISAHVGGGDGKFDIVGCYVSTMLSMEK